MRDLELRRDERDSSKLNEDRCAMLAGGLNDALRLLRFCGHFGTMVVVARVGVAVMVLLSLFKKVVDAVRLGAGESNDENR